MGEIMRNRLFTGIGLLFIAFSVFIVTIAYLPRRGDFGFNGPLDYLVNSRDRWDIAWVVLVAMLACSLGVFLIMEGCGIFNSNKLPKKSND
jgi:hypothetical protein